MNAEYERLRLCAARYAWPRRTTQCPTPYANGVRPTWGQWWSRKFGRGETLETYATRMRTDHGKAPEADGISGA